MHSHTGTRASEAVSPQTRHVRNKPTTEREWNARFPARTCPRRRIVLGKIKQTVVRVQRPAHAANNQPLPSGTVRPLPRSPPAYGVPACSQSGLLSRISCGSIKQYVEMSSPSGSGGLAEKTESKWRYTSISGIG